MKATLLNGALPGDTFVDAVAAALMETLQAEGRTVTRWTLRDERIAYCLGCFECWTKSPGLCRIDDAGREVPASIIGGDLAVYLTPITFGGYSSALKKAVDRSICLISPFFTRIDGEVHHRAPLHRLSVPAGCGRAAGARPGPGADLPHADRPQRHQHARAGSQQRDPLSQSGPRGRRRLRATEFQREGTRMTSPKTALLLIGSGKPAGQSLSEALGCFLAGKLAERGVVVTTMHVARALRTEARQAALLPAVDAADLVILVVSVVRRQPALPGDPGAGADHVRTGQAGPQPRRPFLAIANCGFPEAAHDATALAICRQFAGAAGFEWAGGLALGEGGALSGRPLTEAGGMARNVTAALDLAAAALAEGKPVPQRPSRSWRGRSSRRGPTADGRPRLADAGAAESCLTRLGCAAVGSAK